MENGKWKTENGKVKTERFSESSDYSKYSEYSESSDYSDFSESSDSPATPEFSVFRFPLSVSLRQCLYVVDDFLGAGNQVLTEFLEKGLAGAGLHM